MENLNQLITDVASAVEKLDIAGKEDKLLRLETVASQPGFWQNQDKAKDVSKEIAKLKQKIDPWRELEKKLNDITELAELNDPSLTPELEKDFSKAKLNYQKLELDLMLDGKFDGYDAILAVHAGTGGTDAMDWAEMLERMYLRFAETKGWNTEIVEETVGNEAGLKSATILIKGDNVYGYLQSEHGVHRLVRLSPFNSDNLRQTSFALVEVIPDIDQPDEVQIDEKDLRIDVFRAGGHGGQSVNTTDSAVRITHQPTSIVVSVQNERSQIQNKATALSILRGKLAQLQLTQQAEKISELKGPDQKAAWGNQIRNYVLHPYTMVKDSRSGYETTDAEAVLNGDLDGLVDSYLRSQIGK